MENKDNKLSNILSLIGIIAFFIALIVIVVIIFKNKSNNNDDEYYYAPIGQETTTPEPTATPAVTENVNSIDSLLESLANDIVNLLRCDNPNLLSFYTPGVKLETVATIRSACGQATTDIYEIYKSDGQFATIPNKGEYLIKMNIRTETTANVLYVYVWTDFLNGSYIINGVSYDIGDF